jgi:AdoMet-dependent rRNA methyltransferase SPB1
MGIKEEKAKPLVERDDEEGEKDDDDIVNELDNLTKEEQRKARRDKKRLREKKRKLLERMQLNMQTPTDIGLESSANGTLFTAKAIEQSHHQKLDDVSDDDVDDVASSDEYSTDTDDSTDESGMDSDQERIRSIEKSLDHDYTQFKQHQAERTAKGKVREKEDWEEEEFIPAASRKHADSDSDSDDGSDTPMRPETFDESSDDEAIMQSIHDKRKKQGDGQELSKKAKRFFDNPVFAGMDVDDEEEETKQPSAKAAKQPKQQEEDVMSVDEQEEEEAPHRPELDLVTPEGMTLAQALVNKKVSKQSLIDQGFHRRTYHDENGLPSWFTEDEKQHNRPQIPITKEAVQAIRDRLKVIDARPIKKVYEAKARKKQRALDQASKIAKKQADIVDNPDLTEREKAQTVVKIAKRSKSTLADQKKRKIAVVVAKGGNRALKGRPKGVKGRYKMVDKRMKKDIRAMDNAKKKKGKGRK